MNSNKETNNLPPQLSLIIRLFASVYLIYLALSFGDVGNRYEGAELIFYIIVIGVFAIVGLTIGILSARDLIKGQYIGGKLDNNSDETTPNVSSDSK